MTLFDRLDEKYGGTEWCDPIVDAIADAALDKNLPDWLLVERTLGGYRATWFNNQEHAVDEADRAGWDGCLVPVAQLIAEAEGETS